MAKNEEDERVGTIDDGVCFVDGVFKMFFFPESGWTLVIDSKLRSILEARFGYPVTNGYYHFGGLSGDEVDEFSRLIVTVAQQRNGKIDSQEKIKLYDILCSNSNKFMLPLSPQVLAAIEKLEKNDDQ